MGQIIERADDTLSMEDVGTVTPVVLLAANPSRVKLEIQNTDGTNFVVITTEGTTPVAAPSTALVGKKIAAGQDYSPKVVPRGAITALADTAICRVSIIEG
jgi:hypothetical protein